MANRLKPIFEKIQPGFDSSFYVRKFENEACSNKPQWHFHPEYEIVYIPQGNGKRHIGDHIGRYRAGELVFLGPNLPHLSYSKSEMEIVVQMREDFLGQSLVQIPELRLVRQLFERAKSGIVFHAPAKHKIGQQLVAMVDQSPFHRLLSLLEILHEMATTADYESLKAQGFPVEVNPQDQDRMALLYNFVEEHFQRPIPLAEIAALINMTVPAFCRYFKKLTNRTFTQFVNEFRITYASRLLRDEDMSIAAISFESGFNNLSHFNKQFRQITGQSPREYRQQVQQVVQG